MNILQSIFHKLGVSEREAAPLRISWSLRCLYQVGFIISWTIVTALFVEQFGIEHLLWLFLGEAIIMLMGTNIASIILSRCNLQTYLFTTIILTLTSLMIAFGYHVEDLRFFIFLILAKDLFAFQTSAALFRQDEHFFSPSEAIKTMPFVESAITVGAVLGAALTVQALNFLDTQQVLWLWCGALSIMALIITSTPVVLHSIPQFSLKASSEERVHKNPLREAMRLLRKTRFLRFAVILVLLQASVFAVVEFEFTKDVQSHIMPHHEVHHETGHATHFPLQASFFTEVKERIHDIAEETTVAIKQASTNLIVHETLAHDLGMFHLLFSLGALFVQLILTSKVLERLGVIGSIVSYNAILFLSLFGMILGYGNVNLLRALQHGFHSLGDAPYHISFYSFRSSARESIRIFLEGIVKPCGILLAVGMLLWIPGGSIFYALLGITALLLFLTPFLRSDFTALSEENIEKSHENITEKMHAIEVLSQRGHHRPVTILARELQKPKTPLIVQKKIIQTLTKLNSPKILHTYLEMLRSKDISQEIKARILSSLLEMKSLTSYWSNHAFGQYHLIAVLEELFQSSTDRYFRKLVVMNMFVHLPLHKVVPFFLKTMKKADNDLKAVCLRSCTVFDDPEILHYVRPYLDSKVPRIRGHAVMALWEFGDKKELRSVLKDLLSHKANEEAVIAGIYAIGEVKDDAFRKKLWDLSHKKNPEIKMQALIALAKLNDVRATDPLVEIIFGEDEMLAKRAYGMLRRVPESFQDHIKQIIHCEVCSRVSEVIHPENVHKLDDLRSLPQKAIDRMKRWYTLGEKYDCLMILERL